MERVNGEAEALPKQELRVPLKGELKGLSCKWFVMRELDGMDDIEIGVWVDKRSTSAVSGGKNAATMIAAAVSLQQHEAMRRALVSVNGVPVNVGGVPFKEFDRWSHRTMRVVQEAFRKLNGVEDEELEKQMAGEATTESKTEDPPEIHRPRATGVRSAG